MEEKCFTRQEVQEVLGWLEREKTEVRSWSVTVGSPHESIKVYFMAKINQQFLDQIPKEGLSMKNLVNLWLRQIDFLSRMIDFLCPEHLQYIATGETTALLEKSSGFHDMLGSYLSSYARGEMPQS